MKTAFPLVLLGGLLLPGIYATAESTNSPSEPPHELQAGFRCEGGGEMNCPACKGTGGADCLPVFETLPWQLVSHGSRHDGQTSHHSNCFRPCGDRDR